MIIRVIGRGVGIPTDERNYLEQRGNTKIEDMRKERLRIRTIGGMKIVGGMGMGGKMKSVIMGNIETARGRVRPVVDIENYHQRNRKTIIISVDAGHGQEQEAVVGIENKEGNEQGHTLLERNEPQRLMRRKGRLRRKKKSSLPEWTTNRRAHRLYRRMDLINL